MYDERLLVRVGQPAASLQGLFRIRVESVRRDRRSNQRVIGVLLEEGLRPRERIGWSIGVRNGKANHRLPKYSAEPSLLGGPRNLFLEVIHVGVGGGARQHHLEAAQERAPIAELFVHIAGF